MFKTRQYFQIKSFEVDRTYEGDVVHYKYMPISTGLRFIDDAVETFNNELKIKAISVTVLSIKSTRDASIAIKGSRKHLDLFIKSLLISKFADNFSWRKIERWEAEI